MIGFKKKVLKVLAEYHLVKPAKILFSEEDSYLKNHIDKEAFNSYRVAQEKKFKALLEVLGVEELPPNQGGLKKGNKTALYD